jgi:hypothetical protein
MSDATGASPATGSGPARCLGARSEVACLLIFSANETSSSRALLPVHGVGRRSNTAATCSVPVVPNKLAYLHHHRHPEANHKSIYHDAATFAGKVERRHPGRVHLKAGGLFMASIFWALLITVVVSAVIHAAMERAGLFNVDVTAGFDAGDPWPR